MWGAITFLNPSKFNTYASLYWYHYAQKIMFCRFFQQISDVIFKLYGTFMAYFDEIQKNFNFNRSLVGKTWKTTFVRLAYIGLHIKLEGVPIISNVGVNLDVIDFF